MKHFPASKGLGVTGYCPGEGAWGVRVSPGALMASSWGLRTALGAPSALCLSEGVTLCGGGEAVGPVLSSPCVALLLP